MVASVLRLIALMNMFDCLQCYLQGPIRALGVQDRASYFALACYYLVGVPMAAVLGIVLDFGVMGLQGGMAIAVLIQAIAYIFIIRCSNWQKIADKAEERIKNEANQV